MTWLIPAMMVGGAVTGAICEAVSIGSYAPHGGVFVFFAITNFVGFLVAIAIGTAISTALVIALKQFTRPKGAAELA